MLPDCNCINTSGNLLTNGSFESGTTGWTASGGSVSSGTGYVACGTKNGFNAASKGKLSTVYQDVNHCCGYNRYPQRICRHTYGRLILQSEGQPCIPQRIGYRTGPNRCGCNQGCGCHEWSACPCHDHGQSADGNRQSKVTNNHHLQYHEDGCLLLKDSICFSKGGESDIPFASGWRITTKLKQHCAAVSPNLAINYFNLDIRSDDQRSAGYGSGVEFLWAAVFNKQAQPNTTMRDRSADLEIRRLFCGSDTGWENDGSKTGQKQSTKTEKGCDEQPPFLTRKLNFLYIRWICLLPYGGANCLPVPAYRHKLHILHGFRSCQWGRQPETTAGKNPADSVKVNLLNALSKPISTTTLIRPSSLPHLPKYWRRRSASGPDWPLAPQEHRCVCSMKGTTAMPSKLAAGAGGLPGDRDKKGGQYAE